MQCARCSRNSHPSSFGSGGPVGSAGWVLPYWRSGLRPPQWAADLSTPCAHRSYSKHRAAFPPGRTSCQVRAPQGPTNHPLAPGAWCSAVGSPVEGLPVIFPLTLLLSSLMCLHTPSHSRHLSEEKQPPAGSHPIVRMLLGWHETPQTCPHMSQQAPRAGLASQAVHSQGGKAMRVTLAMAIRVAVKT